LHRDGNAEARQHPAVEGTARARISQDDRDLARWRSVAEEPGDFSAHGLHLGELTRGGEQRDASVVLHWVTGLTEAALHLEQRAAGGEPGFGLQPLDRDALDVPELGEEGASRQGQRLAVLPGQSDRHLDVGGELSHQLQLLDREVVEAVEEDRRFPGLGPCPQRGGRRRGPRVGVVEAELVSNLQVGLVQRGHLDLVRAGVPCLLPQRHRIDQGRLEL
jgi:hypothetical protein